MEKVRANFSMPSRRIECGDSLNAVGAHWIVVGTAAGSGGTDWIARGIALGAVVVALASLTWNVIAWHRQGPVVVGRAVTRPRSVLVTVTNRGRLGTTIDQVWSVRGRFRELQDDLCRNWDATGKRVELPASLAAQAQVPFAFAVDSPPDAVIVYLGSGKTLTIKVLRPRRRHYA
jgi:hypothetical protein